jgi:hypothetical protein
MTIYTYEQAVKKTGATPDKIQSLSNPIDTNTDNAPSDGSSYLNDLLTGKPTFKASEGGATSIPENLAKIAGNIPSSAVGIVKDITSPVNPFDTNSPVNIGSNVVKSASTLSDIYKNQSPMEGTKSILGGFADTYLKIGETLYGGIDKAYNALLDDPKKAIADIVEKIAKVGVEDPLLIPSLLYGGGKNKAGQDAISSIASPITRGADTSLTGIAGKATDIVSPTVSNVINKTSVLSQKLIPKSEEIMNRVARLNPNDARKFTELSNGKTVGQYLTETGNFNRPDKIVNIEADKFISSIKSVDESLAKLPGKFEDGSIKDALTNLVSKAESVSSENVKSPYLDRAKELLNKYNSGGLDMSEINEVKRLFEKNVKLGYNKLLNADKVEQATNIDNALRSWQVKTAEILGFKNIKDLNKQTQLSKFIIDNLGDKIIDKSLLNGVSLSDWIMLSGGDVTGVSGFLTKKFFSDPGVQSRIAKLLNSKEIKGLITPDMRASEILGLPAPKEGMPKSSINVPINQPSRKAIDSGTEIVPNSSKSK